jgi:hypothetical protein
LLGETVRGVTTGKASYGDVHRCRRPNWRVPCVLGNDFAFLATSLAHRNLQMHVVEGSELGSLMTATYKVRRAPGGSVWGVVLLRLTGIWFSVV